MNYLLLVFAFLLAPGAHALSVYTGNALLPTDQNLNLLNLSTVPAGWRLGLFDDAIISSGGTVEFSGAAYLDLNLGGDIATFSPVIGQKRDYTVTNNSGAAVTLTGSDHFLLALNAGSGFSLPDTLSCNSATSLCTLGWSSGSRLYVVDAALTPVPLPATLPLLLSALCGIGAFRRRMILPGCRTVWADSTSGHDTRANPD